MDPDGETEIHDGKVANMEENEPNKNGIVLFPEAPSEKSRRILKERTESVKQKYGGTINVKADRSKIADHLNRMRMLMAEWNPVGCPVDDLTGIAGEPTDVDEGVHIYRFDTGLFGSEWRFKVEKGTVYSVSLELFG